MAEIISKDEYDKVIKERDNLIRINELFVKKFTILDNTINMSEKENDGNNIYKDILRDKHNEQISRLMGKNKKIQKELDDKNVEYDKIIKKLDERISEVENRFKEENRQFKEEIKKLNDKIDNINKI